MDFHQLAARGKAAQAQRIAEGRKAGRSLFAESALGYDARKPAQPKAVTHPPGPESAPVPRGTDGRRGGRSLDFGAPKGRVAYRWGSTHGSGQDRAIAHEERD